MTKGELIEALKEYAEDREVFVRGCSCPYNHEIKRVGLTDGEAPSTNHPDELVIYPAT